MVFLYCPGKGNDEQTQLRMLDDVGDTKQQKYEQNQHIAAEALLTNSQGSSQCCPHVALCKHNKGREKLDPETPRVPS